MNRDFKTALTILVLSLTLYSGHVRAQEKVVLQLKWTHAFQFAGYYAAKEKGYYKEAGLNVEIKQANATLDVVREVVEGRANYGVGTSSLILARHAGHKVVVLATIFQHSALVLIIPEPQAINGVKGLSNKRIMIDPLSDEVAAYLQREGLDDRHYTRVPHSFKLQDLIDGKVDASVGYISNQPFTLNEARFKYKTFSPRNVGIDFYGDNLFTSENEIKNHPERAKAFLDASLKGWRYALENRDEMIRLILQKYPTQLTAAQLEYEFDTLKPLIQADTVTLGYIYPDRWRHIANVYAEMGMLPKNIPLQGFLYAPPQEFDLRSFYFALAIFIGIALVIGGISSYLYNANKKLKRSLADVASANEERERLLSMLEHELRNPMSVIRMVLTNPTTDASQRKMADKAVRDIDQLISRCMQMDRLDQSAMRSHFVSCDLKQILDNIISNVQDEQRVLVLSDQTVIPKIHTDPYILQLILFNLVDNAIKYSASLSTISISIDEIRHTNPQEKVPTSRQYLCVSISNEAGTSGHPDPEKIFTKFYRSPATHAKIGAGLGLYLVKKLCTLIHASIEYIPTNEHIRFQLCIPL